MADGLLRDSIVCVDVGEVQRRQGARAGPLGVARPLVTE
jgi:hypothetical protein